MADMTGHSGRTDLDLEEVMGQSGQGHNLGWGLHCPSQGVQVLCYEGGVQFLRCKCRVTRQALQKGYICWQPAHLSSSNAFLSL